MRSLLPALTTVGFLFSALAASPVAHAEEPSPVVAGLATGLSSAALALPGSFAGLYGWNAVDNKVVNNCANAVDNCMEPGAARAIVLGMPVGASLFEVAGGTLTHSFVVGRGNARVTTAGLGTAAAGFGLASAGYLVARNSDHLEVAAPLYLTGVATSVLGPPIAMGVVSGRQAGPSRALSPVARVARVEQVGALVVEGGGGLRIGGSW